jgi:saccharopine dehydrogenase-like NADP-dependent oxidoreductase
MRVIVFGSTGMVGQGVLRECLRDGDVTEVITVLRSSSGVRDPKLREIIHKDLSALAAATVKSRVMRA